MDFYEIFAIQKLTNEEACCSLSKSAVIPRSTIGYQCDLFDPLLEDTSLLLGIELLYYSEGYIMFFGMCV